jgi:hypothetical protein
VPWRGGRGSWGCRCRSRPPSPGRIAVWTPSPWPGEHSPACTPPDPYPLGKRQTEGGRDKRGCERRRGSGSRGEEREKEGMREEIWQDTKSTFQRIGFHSNLQNMQTICDKGMRSIDSNVLLGYHIWKRVQHCRCSWVWNNVRLNKPIIKTLHRPMWFDLWTQLNKHLPTISRLRLRCTQKNTLRQWCIIPCKRWTLSRLRAHDLLLPYVH